MLLLLLLLLRYCLLVREREYGLGLRLGVLHDVHVWSISSELIHGLCHLRLSTIGSIHYGTIGTTVS